MTSPAHVHDDSHAVGDDFESWGWSGAATHIQDYVSSNQLSATLSSDFQGLLQDYFQSEPQIPSEASGLGFVQALARFSYDLTTYRGVFETRQTQTADSELERMFGTPVFDSLWWTFDLDNIGTWGGSCGGDAADEWWAMSNAFGHRQECVEEVLGIGLYRESGNFYVENNGGEVDPLSPAVWETEGNFGDCTGVGVCSTLDRIYGDVMYSAAAVYGAGLIRSFVWASLPPKVEGHSPAANGTAGVDIDIRIVFTEPIATGSLTSSNITVRGSVSQTHSATFPYQEDARTLTIAPSSTFSAGETVTVTLSGNIVDRDVPAKGLAGAVGGSSGPGYSFTFVVAAAGTPSSPTNLSATATSASSVALNWTDTASNESGFRVERASNGTGPFAARATLGSGVTSYSDNSVVEGLTYFYRVIAVNGQGDSGPSNIASATPSSGGSTPSAPTQLSAHAGSSSEINLAWRDNSTTESGFKIERKDPGGNWFQITAVGSGVTSFHNGNLVANSTYQYRVFAYNSSGPSGYSNVASATTEAATPAAPDSASAAALDAGRVQVSWRDRSSTENGFEIERRTGASGTWSLQGYASRDETHWTDQFVNANTDYYYRVRAHNAEGYSSYSNTAQVTTCVAPDAPHQSDPYDGEDDLPLALDLIWWTNDDAASYDVYLGTANPPPFIASLAPAPNGDDTVYSAAGLSPGQVYYWKVVAHAACNPALISSSSVHAFLTMGTPGVPDLLSPSNNATGIATGVVVDWANVTTPGSTLYDLYFGTTNPPPLFEAMGTVTERLMQALSSNTQYFWKVRAKNADNPTLFSESAAWSFTTGSGSSATVTIVTAKDAGLRGGSFGNVNYGGLVGGPAEQKAFGTGNDDNYYQTPGSAPLRGAIQFNLSSIPAGATVTNATLILRLQQMNGSQTAPLAIYFDPYSAAWTEKGAGGITWNNKPAVNTTHRVTGTFPLSGYNPLRNSVTPLVQKWLNGTIPNNGFEVSIPAWEALAHQAKYFGQWENGGSFGGAELEVTYTLPCAAPPAPTSPSPAPGATGQGQSVNLDWADTAGASSYRVYFGPAPSSPAVAVSAASSFPVTGLLPSTTYYWRVAALAGCDTNLATTSAEWSFQTGSCFPPSVPATVFPAVGAGGLPRLASLTWSGVAGAGSYDVYLDTANPPATLVGATSSTSLQVSLTPGVAYFWRVRAHATCDPTLTTDSPLGIFTTAVRPSAEAGANRTIAVGVATDLGGSPTGSGGVAPYTYAWTVSPEGASLSSAIVANPSLIASASGIYTCELVVTDSNGFSSFLDQVSVTVPESPLISVAPGNLDFGAVELGNYSDLAFSVHNAGGGTLAGSATTAPPFTIQGSASYNLAGGESIDVTIRFTPVQDAVSAGQVSFSGGGSASSQVLGVGIPAGLVFRDGFESGGLGNWSSAAGGLFFCSHAICDPGGLLAIECDPCVAAVGAFEAFCVDLDWDEACVQRVRDGDCAKLSCPPR